MNQQIIDYLQQNKDAYTKESLIQQLRNAGYAENEIQEAVKVVYGTDFLSNNNISTPNVPMPQMHAEVPSASLNKNIFIAGAVLFVFFLTFVGIVFMMKKNGSNVSDNIQTLSAVENVHVTEEKNIAKTQVEIKNADVKKSVCLTNATDSDISKYDHLKTEDEVLTMIGVDYANLLNYEKAAICLEEALDAVAKRSETAEVSKAYIDDIRLKLSVVYIQLGADDKAEALLEEITNHKYK